MAAFRRSSTARPKSRLTVTIFALTALALFSLLSPVFLSGSENEPDGGRHFVRSIKQDLAVRKDVEKSVKSIDALLPPRLVEEADRQQGLTRKSQDVLIHDVDFKRVNDVQQLSITLPDDNSQERQDLSREGQRGTPEIKQESQPQNLPNTSDPAWIIRQAAREKRRTKRIIDFMSADESDPAEVAEKQAESLSRKLNSSNSSLNFPLKHEVPTEVSDQLLRVMREQLIMARGYLALAQQKGDKMLVKELRGKLKEGIRTVGEATNDSELPKNAMEATRTMGQLLKKARDKHYNCADMVKKLRALVQAAEDQTRALKRQTTYLSQLAAKTMPRGLTCLTLRLTLEYAELRPEQREFGLKPRLVDNSLFHYALFSDNVLAASVVVNSTVMNAKDSRQHVFHIVTDQLNFPAMKMWFLLNPPAKAAIEVQNINDFKWLNSSYCPVLHQLETSAMKDYYFKSNAESSASDGQFLKYRNPKYLSMLNHLRFYLPEVFPALNKVLFVDDDIVVQEDLTPLWKVDLEGKVNGAVETCGASFHRFDKYLNFSHPLIAANFDPQACGWAYGMNLFDLVAWKKYDMTGTYHYWQTKNEDRTLWKLGTLPPGLITFYNTTKPLDKHWHALGMGYNPNIDLDDLRRSAVVHYNGNMKPWLDIAMTKFKPFWTRYVKYDHPFLQQCNLS